jgi:methionine aminopeptidase
MINEVKIRKVQDRLKAAILQIEKEENVKIDFGVHINGWIIDSAESIYFNPKYHNCPLPIKRYYSNFYSGHLRLLSKIKIIELVSAI